MQKWEQQLNFLLNGNVIGVYKCCCVTKIVLSEKATGKAWNYFTHIHFSSVHLEENESELLSVPASISKDFQVIISQYTMNKEKFWQCVQDAISLGIWNYTDSKIYEGDKLDHIFVSGIKFVSENDPFSCIYENVIPLEESLYGSNCMGNYYIFELYSRKDYLNSILSPTLIKKIQDKILNSKLSFRLDKLDDRIGNIVCRFDVETLKAVPVKLCEYGTEFDFKLTDQATDEMNIIVHIEQEHDRLIYDYSDEDITIKPGDSIRKGVGPNQCKTTVSVSEKKSGFLLFRIVSDQSIYSNYHSQITPSTFLGFAHQEYRKLIIGGKEVAIPLDGNKLLGRIEWLVEMSEAGKRQQKWEDIFFKEKSILIFTQLENMIKRLQIFELS